MSESADPQEDSQGDAGLPSFDPKASHTLKQWKHDAPLVGGRFDPTGRFVFAGAMDHSIQRWDWQADKHHSLQGHESWLRGIGFSNDGTQMFSAGYDGRLCFWDTLTEDSKPKRQIEAHHGWIRWLAVHPSQPILATGGNDLAVRLWSTESGELIRELKGHEKHIYSLYFHPDGEFLLSGDLAGQVNQWEVSTGNLSRSFDSKPLHTYHKGQRVDYGGVRCMTLTPDKQQLACGGLHKATNPFAGVQEPLVVVFEWETGKQIRTHEATEIPRGIVWRLFVQEDGTLVAGVGGQDGYLVFWSDDKNDFHKQKMDSPITDLDRHPNQLDLLTVHFNGYARLTRMAKKSESEA